MPANEVVLTGERLVREPVRPLTTEHVGLAYPGELLIDKSTGDFKYVTPEGTQIEHKKPGKLTVRYGETLLCENADLSGVIDLTIPEGGGSSGDVVLQTTKVNGHELTGDITLTAADVGALPASGEKVAFTLSDNTLDRMTVNGTHNIGFTDTSKTLPTASSWSGSGPYTYALSYPGVVDGDRPIIDMRPTGTYATDKSIEQDWAQIYNIVATADTLTFYTHTKPAVAIPLTIKFI